MLLLAFAATSNESAGPKVRCGADLLVAQRLDLVRGKRVGLITNHTGRLADGMFLVDTLRSLGIQIVALFGPEHGIRGAAGAGEAVMNGVDKKTGIPVYSLYGDTRKPTAEMLRDVDVLIYDIQDVGARFYTYISTMGLCMEAAAEHNIPFIVLDRPNPLGGIRVEGPIVEDTLRSFVGALPIPIVYGLTCGELARMAADEGWLAGHVRPLLTVVAMEGWTRSMRWDATGLEWIPPSPNIPRFATALIYPGTCLIEATSFSEGRGTPAPFETFGAPHIDASFIVKSLREENLAGTSWDTTSFVPTTSKYQGVACTAIRLTVTNPATFSPVATGIALLCQFQKRESAFSLKPRILGLLSGSSRLAAQIAAGVSPAEIMAEWSRESTQFAEKSKAYYLYSAR